MDEATTGGEPWRRRLGRLADHEREQQVAEHRRWVDAVGDAGERRRQLGGIRGQVQRQRRRALRDARVVAPVQLHGRTVGEGSSTYGRPGAAGLRAARDGVSRGEREAAPERVRRLRVGHGRRRRAGDARPGRRGPASRGGRGMAGQSRSTPAWPGPAAHRSTAAAGSIRTSITSIGSWRPTSRCPTRACTRSPGTWSAQRSSIHGSEDLKRRFLRPDLPRRDAVLPAAQRARGRLRPRRAAHPRRQGRRRVGRQRPEGLELLRPQGQARSADGAHRPRRAQAPGADDVPAPDGHARRRGPPAAPDDRRRRVQRGLPDRRAGARRQPCRRAGQRMAGGADRR